MKVSIDREGCISCELCTSICPDVFRMAADDLAEVYVDEIPPELEDDVREAADSCPSEVIIVK